MNYWSETMDPATEVWRVREAVAGIPKQECLPQRYRSAMGLPSAWEVPWPRVAVPYRLLPPRALIGQFLFSSSAQSPRIPSIKPVANGRQSFSPRGRAGPGEYSYFSNVRLFDPFCYEGQRWKLRPHCLRKLIQGAPGKVQGLFPPFNLTGDLFFSDLLKDPPECRTFYKAQG